MQRSGLEERNVGQELRGLMKDGAERNWTKKIDAEAMLKQTNESWIPKARIWVHKIIPAEDCKYCKGTTGRLCLLWYHIKKDELAGIILLLQTWDTYTVYNLYN